MVAYLAGSIEFSHDHGRGWRRELRSFLEERLGHQVYDPVEDEKQNLDDEEVKSFRSWKCTDSERYRRAVRKIIDFDLDLIEGRTDYIVCFWQGHTVQGGGTPAEITAAYRNGISVYLVTDLPVSELSGWVLVCAERVFANFDELKAFLINSQDRGLLALNRNAKTASGGANS